MAPQDWWQKDIPNLLLFHGCPVAVHSESEGLCGEILVSEEEDKGIISEHAIKGMHSPNYSGQAIKDMKVVLIRGRDVNSMKKS